MREYEECRPYIEHWIAEHRRLHRLLRQARSSMMHSGGADGEGACRQVVPILKDLRQELAHHFVQEEAGGCMDEAVSLCPRLSAEVKRIERQHPELLAAVDRLIADAQDCDYQVQRQIALHHAFDDLCRELDAHETAENSVLKQGFGTNLNGDALESPVVHRQAEQVPRTGLGCC